MPDAEADVRNRITGAIHGFLSVLQGRDPNPRPTLSDLAKALDHLVAVYHATPNVEPDTETMAPRVEERPILDRAAAVFPDLGWYAIVEPEEGVDQEIGLSIAVGDLGEIAADLINVLWLFENSTHNDAVWEFRSGYGIHWGRHLHEIRVYLHSLSAW